MVVKHRWRCLLFSNEMRLKLLAAFVGLYLPMDIHFAIGNFIRDCIIGKTILIKGDGRPYLSYLYAADLAVDDFFKGKLGFYKSIAQKAQ
jgi:nucleoside-diphosphate-sugar epimerase